jgi:uncharacterized protein YqjF (DUF2071 family)
MKEVTGIISHRILLNFKVDPEIMRKILPVEFKPKVINGYCIAGICQVSLINMRVKGAPALLGTSSNNAAHRIAVDTIKGEGVYVTRRDTDSWINSLSGGRIFPGVYNKTKFDLNVSGDNYKVTVHEQKNTLMSIDASVVKELPIGSVFETINDVSEFFKTGNIAWSPSDKKSKYDAIELATTHWQMEPLKVRNCYSSYFSDTSKFPEGSVTFDSAIIMRNINHSWVSRDNLCQLCSL